MGEMCSITASVLVVCNRRLIELRLNIIFTSIQEWKEKGDPVLHIEVILSKIDHLTLNSNFNPQL